MESVKWHIQKNNKDTKRGREINKGNTTGYSVGRQRYSDVSKNTNRKNRLEWKC